MFENLKQGMEFKNYKALCEFLGIAPTGGKVKQLVIEELGRCAEFHKVGNKIIIDEVLKVAAEKIDKRKDPTKKSNNAMYSNDIQALIINLLAGADGHTVYLPINRILRILDMVNCNYSEAKKSIPKLSEITCVPESYCYEFFNTNNVQLKNKLETALRGLRRRALITFQECISVCVLESDEEYNAFGDIKITPVNKKQSAMAYKRIHREATEEEVKLILHCEFLTLEEMKCSSQQYVFLSGKWGEYQKKVNEKISELANIEYYYNSYRLIYNLSDVTKVHLRQLEQEEQENIKTNLNNNINKMVNKYANTLHTRAKKKVLLNANDVVQSSDDYVKHMETLNNIVIKKDAKDIRKELKKPLKKQEENYNQFTIEDLLKES